MNASEFFRRNSLLFVVFLTGASVLIVEVVALRILSPYYGNTIFSASSVISVILAALSAGYYIGGLLADRYPSQRWFYGIILVSGISVLFVHILVLQLLPVLGYGLSVITGPLVSSIILFFTPALLLGTLSPFAIRLQQQREPKKGVGTTAGTVFFWSTLGSIAGSLGAGFILIPKLGVNEIVGGVGVLLVILGLVPLVLRREINIRTVAKITLTVLVALAAIHLLIRLQANEHIVFADDGVYERLVIFDARSEDGRDARFLRQDRVSSGAMFLNSDDHVYEYSKYYAFFPIFVPNMQDVLVIGGGAYTVPRVLVSEMPDVRVDVVEIEPELFSLAQRYFRVPDDPRLANHVQDGRRFLHDTEETYDVIFSDAYQSLFSIPAHFTTKEFFELAKSKLTPEGIFVGNFIGDLADRDPSLMLSVMKTFRSVFPNSYFFATNSPDFTDVQNIMVFGINGEGTVDVQSDEFVYHDKEVVRRASDHLIDVDRYDLSPHDVLTDNYAPVEYLTAQVLRHSTYIKSVSQWPVQD